MASMIWQIISDGVGEDKYIPPMTTQLLGKVNIPITLAPMVGISHVAVRLMLREYLPEGAVTLWPTEMLNSRKIPKQDLTENPLSLRGEEETELSPQILGNEEIPIKESVACLKDWGAESIDINMGCPVNKALRHNYGVSLMGDIGYARDVVAMTVKHTDLPVSVKIRAGFQKDRDFLKRFVLALQDGGASWLTLHPRLASEKRRGRADWSQIQFIKEILDIPVIGNGDVQNCTDVFEMLEQTGCDMVMVGRALTARPWLLWQVGASLGFEPPPGRRSDELPRTPEMEAIEYGRSLMTLLKYTKQYYEERLGLVRLKFYVKTSNVWLNFGHSLFTQTRVCKTYDDFENTIKKFFESNSLAMTQKTDLRE